MAASNGGGGGGPISAEAAAALGEGIRLVFGRWTALQMAVENQWGGRDSRAKADNFAASVLSWLCNSKGNLLLPFHQHSPLILLALMRNLVVKACV